MKRLRDFVETALYHPKTGYYSRREAGADFYTAPEIHPAFGKVLAREILSLLKRVSERRPKDQLFLVEMGAGNGRLFRTILETISEESSSWRSRIRCVVVERTEGSLFEAITQLSGLSRAMLGYSNLSDLLPASGVFFSNELVDALPSHILEKRRGRMWEVYVSENGEEDLGRLSDPELMNFAKKMEPHIEEGERRTVALDALRWLRTVNLKLKAGYLITVDFGRRYGLTGAQTPKTFYRHYPGKDFLSRPGKQDICFPVDFDLLIEEGKSLGMRMESFQTMGSFLIERGILELLPAGISGTSVLRHRSSRYTSEDKRDINSFQERNKVKTLFHPEGMGDIFKVLIQSKGMGIENL